MNTKSRIKIRLLKDYFRKRPEVSMAFVFGSYAKKRQIKESDFDVAVYFTPEGRAIEWENTRYYSGEDEIWLDIEKIIGIKTDFVVLNRVSSTLAFSVIREGIPIIIKDRSLYLRFLLAVSSAAEYFREFIGDFWAIKQRSMSLAEDDRERLVRIADFLETEIRYYSEFSGITQDSYESSAALRRNVERWVENIVNSSIDIAKIVLASRKKRMPQTYRDVLRELSLIKGFSKDTADKLAQFAKLRNILAHEYLDIRFTHIKRFIENSETAYKKLLDFVKALLA